jgi:hypothetical protein
MAISEAKRLRQLECENAKLKKLLAEAMLDNAMLKEITVKNGSARRQAGSGGSGLPPDGCFNAPLANAGGVSGASFYRQERLGFAAEARSTPSLDGLAELID